MAKVGGSLPPGRLAAVEPRAATRSGAGADFGSEIRSLPPWSWRSAQGVKRSSRLVVGCALAVAVAGATHCGREAESARRGAGVVGPVSHNFPERLPASAVLGGSTSQGAKPGGGRDAPVAPAVVWQFRAASPSAGPPAVSSEGRVFLSTVEGSVHALSGDGQLQWSYTMEGLPQGGPLATEDGRVLLATSIGRIYCLNADGTPAWTKRSRRRIVSPVIAVGDRFLAYAGADGLVRGIARSAGQSWSRRLGEKVITSPVAASAAFGVIAVTRKAQASKLWWLSPGQRSASVSLPHPPVHAPLSLGALTMVVAGDELLALQRGREQPVWRTRARLAASDVSGTHLVVVRHGELSWVDPSSGEALHALALPERVCAPPLVLADGTVVAPLVTGDVFIARRGGGPEVSVSVFNTPLRSPVSAAVVGQADSQYRVVVASGAGGVAMLDLSRWLGAERSRAGRDAGT